MTMIYEYWNESVEYSNFQNKKKFSLSKGGMSV